MVGEVQTLDTSELGLDYRLSRKHKIHNVWKTRKRIKVFHCLFYPRNVECCSRLFPLLHYCGNSSLDISLPLINIIVIVYYADLSCDMQDQELLLSHWSVFLAPTSHWLSCVSLPLARDAISSQPWPHSSWDISGLWMLWFSSKRDLRQTWDRKRKTRQTDKHFLSCWWSKKYITSL